jgi:protein O-mannosyl-transferase
LTRRRERREAKAARDKAAGSRSGVRSTEAVDGPAPSARDSWLLAAALVAVTVLVYAPVRDDGFFMMDDPFYVYQNLSVTAGLKLESIKWALTSGDYSNWHPLTWISHMTDVQLFGVNAGAHKIVSVGFHVANTLLLFWLLLRMTGMAGRSALVAALFALHPMHVESVAWVSERKDVLSTFFGMLTMIAYVAWLKDRQAWRYAGMCVLFALSLMSKPMLVTMPFVLMLLDVWPLRRITLADPPRAWLRLAWQKLPLFALTVASSVITFLVQRAAGAVQSVQRISVPDRIAHTVVAYGKYIRKLVLPYDLGIPYPYSAEIPAATVLASLLLVGAVSFFAVRTLRSHPYVAVGWFWFFGTLVPVIGLVQVGQQDMADRYSYVPAIGLFILVAWGAPFLLQRKGVGRPVLIALALLVTGAYTIVARKQVEAWHSSTTMFAHTAAVTRDNYMAESGLGWALGQEKRYQEAELHLHEALRIRPQHVPAHTNLGEVLTDQGKLEEAAEHYAEAARLDPTLVMVHAQLAITYSRMRRDDEAMAAFENALRVLPDYASAHNGMALVLARHGKIAEAIDHYRKAIDSQPDFAEAHNNLGVTFAGQSQLDSAVAHFSEAVRAKPDYGEAYANLGVALSTLGRSAEAVEALQNALRINPQYESSRQLLEALQRGPS